MFSLTAFQTDARKKGRVPNPGWMPFAGRRQADGRLVFDDHRQPAPVVVWVSQMVQAVEKT